MDTREKILPLNDLGRLLGTGDWVIAVGQFDPLTAAQAQRLGALRTDGARLLAIVLEDSDALLPGDARAKLIAALRAVDAVTIAAPEQWRGVIASTAQVRVVEDAAAEELRSADFVRYVVARQATAFEGADGR